MSLVSNIEHLGMGCSSSEFLFSICHENVSVDRTLLFISSWVPFDEYRSIRDYEIYKPMTQVRTTIGKMMSFYNKNWTPGPDNPEFIYFIYFSGCPLTLSTPTAYGCYGSRRSAELHITSQCVYNAEYYKHFNLHMLEDYISRGYLKNPKIN